MLCRRQQQGPDYPQCNCPCKYYQQLVLPLCDYSLYKQLCFLRKQRNSNHNRGTGSSVSHKFECPAGKLMCKYQELDRTSCNSGMTCNCQFLQNKFCKTSHSLDTRSYQQAQSHQPDKSSSKLRHRSKDRAGLNSKRCKSRSCSCKSCSYLCTRDKGSVMHLRHTHSGMN